MDWETQQLTARRAIDIPTAQQRPTQINDTTSALVVGAQPSGFTVLAVGANSNREYLLIQNNTTVNISIAVGNAGSATGLLIVPGGYYERQIYCFVSAVYITLLAASGANDYVTIEEGSIST